MIEQAAILGLNHLLRDAQWARDRLVPLAGKTACLALPPFRFAFAIQSDGTIAEASVEHPDVTITLPAGAPLHALQGADAVLRETRVTGSAEMADTLGFVLRNLRWDWEEDLSRVIGDIASRRVASVVQRFAGWQRNAARNAVENVVEYLREEQPTLTGRGPAGEFAGAVDVLRDDLARLEKRIERIEGRVSRNAASH